MTSPIPPPSTELAPFALRLGILVLPTFGLRILFGRIALGLRFMSAGKVSLQMQAHFVEIHEHYLIELSNMTLLLCTVH